MRAQTEKLTADEQAILNTFRKLSSEKKEAAAYHCNYLLTHEPREELDIQDTLNGFLREMGYIE